MKRALKKLSTAGIYYFVDGERIAGASPDIWGDVTGIRGNVSGISGNVDDCEITNAERKEGVAINDLITEV